MQEFLIVAGVHLLAVMSPGPDFVMMLRNSLIYSRKTALFSAVGLGLGILVHVTYSLFGIALIISQSLLLFNIVKYVGAAYLIYIGVQSLRSKKAQQDPAIIMEHKEKDISPFRAVRMGFLTNVLNPKATLFFLALFTQVINPSTSFIIKVAYGLEMSIVTALWFGVVAVFMTQPVIRKRFIRVKHYIERFFGAILIGLGIKVALSTSK